jgi:hypothetical protein
VPGRIIAGPSTSGRKFSWRSQAVFSLAMSMWASAFLLISPAFRL